MQWNTIQKEKTWWNIKYILLHENKSNYTLYNLFIIESIFTPTGNTDEHSVIPCLGHARRNLHWFAIGSGTPTALQATLPKHKRHPNKTTWLHSAVLRGLTETPFSGKQTEINNIFNQHNMKENEP